MNISIKIGNVEYQNPVAVASGTFSYEEEYSDKKELKKLGAIIPKTITLYPQEGNPPPRTCETAAGMLNAIGLQNLGVGDFVNHKLPVLTTIGVPLIISFSGQNDQEFIQIASKLNEAKNISAYELNLSCPNLQKKELVAQDGAATARVVKAVKQISKVPVIAKLSPHVTDICEIALAAEEAGADAVSLINTFPAMAIDVDKRKPVLGNITGGLSGPAIKPIAVYMVYKTAQAVKIPIIAMGGIMTADDALEFLIAGASMVAVGTANFINPRAPFEILDGIKRYMSKHQMDDIKNLIGSLKG